MSDPTGHNLPEVVGRWQQIIANQALPAAGAWLRGEMPCPDKDALTVFVEYDENAAGTAGEIEMLIEFSPFSVDQTTGLTWYRDQAFSVGTVNVGVETVSELAPELIQWAPLGTDREGFFIQMALNRNVERIRISVRESGQVANPGECRVIAVTG